MNERETNFISAVVYVCDNEATITEVLTNINRSLAKCFKNYEIICVNDGSKDRSAEAIRKFASKVKNAKISMVNMGYYHGVDLAMECGVDFAIGDFVYEFDNNYNDYDEGVIKKVYDKCLEGFDIVSASNEERTSGAKLFYRIFNKHSNLEYKLQTETFRIMSRRAVNRVNSLNNAMLYRKAVYANCGLKICNIKYKPVVSERRIITDEARRNRKKVAANALILFTDVGYKFALTMAMVMLAVSIGVGIYTIVVFATGNPMQGWTTTMLFLAFGFFGMFALITIVIKYMDLLIDLNFKRKQYVVEGIEKLN
ncbi:glycosyltransferase [Candidatus Saccharibacteria bacterium]|nr:glycosyltransferase [Candidatus Saccharibacteria bacterium]